MADTQNPKSAGALSPEQRKRVAAALVEHGATAPCNRCGAEYVHLGVIPAIHHVNLFTLAEAITGVQEQSL
jgi:hypothetical protein